MTDPRFETVREGITEKGMGYEPADDALAALDSIEAEYERAVNAALDSSLSLGRLEARLAEAEEALGQAWRRVVPMTTTPRDIEEAVETVREVLDREPELNDRDDALAALDSIEADYADRVAEWELMKVARDNWREYSDKNAARLAKAEKALREIAKHLERTDIGWKGTAEALIACAYFENVEGEGGDAAERGERPIETGTRPATSPSASPGAGAQSGGTP